MMYEERSQQSPLQVSVTDAILKILLPYFRGTRPKAFNRVLVSVSCEAQNRHTEG